MSAIALAASFCAADAVSRADPNTGIVYGRVLISGTRQPVCPITVTVESNREPAQRTHTRADGSFVFFSVSPGPVELIAGQMRAIRSAVVSANLQNLDTYVNPIFLPPLPAARPRVTNHVTSNRAIHTEYCGSASYHGYFGDYVL